MSANITFQINMWNRNGSYPSVETRNNLLKKIKDKIIASDIGGPIENNSSYVCDLTSVYTDTSEVLNDLFAKYAKDNPGTIIEYKYKDYDYDESFITRFQNDDIETVTEETIFPAHQKIIIPEVPESEKDKELHEYYVSVAINARYHTKVLASNLEEAKNRANENTMFSANMGELEIIDWNIVNAEDQDGNIHDY
jgi:hypothetical protein